MEQRLVLATRNQHKVVEIQEMLKEQGVQVVPVSSIGDFPEIVEDGETFVDNAVKKALVTAKRTKMWSLADDSGLEVDALDGRPGVYSARYAGEQGNDQKNNEKLLKQLQDVPPAKRGAQFKCVLALASPSNDVVTFEGLCRGIIAESARGNQGFGYDPLFIIPQYQKTFAELGADIKNSISHRARALSSFLKYLAEEKVEFYH